MRVATSFVICALVAGCDRDPLDSCPELAVGDLVVTEVRGPQSPDDGNGPWIELYNASSGTVDLVGARIRFRRKDGSSEIPVLVRRALTIGPGEYAVLGLFFDDNPDLPRPPHIDYGFLDDYEGSWLAAAAIDLETCGERVDVSTYDVLPDTGTYSLGTMPDAETNDLPTSWCFDATPAGTPGAANTACP